MCLVKLSFRERARLSFGFGAGAPSAPRVAQRERFLKPVARAAELHEPVVVDGSVHDRGVRLVFQVFADAYEAQSAVITTNLEFSRWGSVFGDDQMAAAVIDRIVRHGRLVRFRGESCRVRHALMQEGWVLKKRARRRRARCSIPDDHSAQIFLTKRRLMGAHYKSCGPSSCSSENSP